MFAVIRNFLTLLLAISSIGCVGANFVRPEAGFLKNGVTTYAEVVGRFGIPYQVGSMTKNERAVKFAAYAHRTRGEAHRDGVLATRLMTLFFFDDKLVGHTFVSSWADDHTDFDETKVPQISKGKSTRSQVVSFLGRPSGYYWYPLIKERRGEAAVYEYYEQELVASIFTGVHGVRLYVKRLTVTFDTNGIVTDVEFETVRSASQRFIVWPPNRGVLNIGHLRDREKSTSGVRLPVESCRAFCQEGRNCLSHFG